MYKSLFNFNNFFFLRENLYYKYDLCLINKFKITFFEILYENALGSSP